MSRTLVVVSAGLSSPSSTRLLGDRLAVATAREVDAEIRVVELRDLATDIAGNLVTGFPSPKLSDAIETVTGADGLIVVTPIFNASYSGLFKSFFDVIEAGSLRGKPVLIAATAGTARHSLALEFALRPLFAYLRADVVPTAVFAASVDWGASDSPDGDLTARIDRAAGELAAVMAGRPAAAPGAEEDEFVPFGEQLARLGITS